MVLDFSTLAVSLSERATEQNACNLIALVVLSSNSVSERLKDVAYRRHFHTSPWFVQYYVGKT